MDDHAQVRSGPRRGHPRPSPPSRVGAGICEPHPDCQVGQDRVDYLPCGTPLPPLPSGSPLRCGADLCPVGVRPVGEPIRPTQPPLRHDGLGRGGAQLGARDIQAVGGDTLGGWVSRCRGPWTLGWPARMRTRRAAPQRAT
jgi:hypothetical protein